MTVSGADPVWRTLQVTNIPIGTTRFQLEQVFADIGPVKKCFVVKPKEGRNNTVGFVTFALEDDCKSALELQDPKIDGIFLNVKIAPDKKIFSKNSHEPVGPQNDPSKNISKNKARLIVRNISFKTDEKSLKSFFSNHGTVVDVNILKKADGKMVGCAFVEFKKVSDATAAIGAANGKQLLGRPIAVDWAVPKEVFAHKKTEFDVKEEDIKEEVDEEEEEERAQTKLETKPEELSDEENEDSEDGERSDEDEENEEEFQDLEASNVKENSVNQLPAVSKPHNLATGHDVDEQKTVFIRNISYDTEETDLAALMEDNFGPVIFAKLVMDKQMGHPKGTGFVKFRKREHAEKCVQVGEGEEGVYLDNRLLVIMMAQNKGEVEQKQKERVQKEPKDNRNLYLAREGIIREGTAAAEGVSASDMARRKVVEKQKKHLLKSLNMFVSSQRLVVRNLPDYVDDSKLRLIFAKHVPKSAKITEAKVMKDKATGTDKPKSKEFGFVTFQKHEDALLALRNVNNNPTIFKPDRRPIVEFSIENRKALLARQKRMEKSREKNPNYKDKSDSGKLETVNKEKCDNLEKTGFAGMVSDPKQKGLPTHSGPKVRTGKKAITRKDLKNQEQDRKNPKKRKKLIEKKLKVVPDEPLAKKSKKALRKEKKQSKEAVREIESEKKFNNLVKSYVNNIKSNEQVAKKWFES